MPGSLLFRPSTTRGMFTICFQGKTTKLSWHAYILCEIHYNHLLRSARPVLLRRFSRSRGISRSQFRFAPRSRDTFRSVRNGTRRFDGADKCGSPRITPSRIRTLCKILWDALAILSPVTIHFFYSALNIGSMNDVTRRDAARRRNTLLNLLSSRHFIYFLRSRIRKY